MLLDVPLGKSDNVGAVANILNPIPAIPVGP